MSTETHEEGVISPTLCEFFNLPFYTTMTEEEVTLKLWNYIHQNKLIIDERVILLNAAIHPVIHPHFIEEYGHGNGNCDDEKHHVEYSIIMVYVAKMHLDPTFIENDIQTRLNRIRMNIAARKVFRYWKTKRNNPVPEKQEQHLWQAHSSSGKWCKYLAKKYNSSNHSNVNGWYDAPQFD